MNNIAEYIKSNAFYNSSVFITQENEDNTYIYFELSYMPVRKVYIRMMMTSQVNKTCDVIYQCVYDQFDYSIRAPQEYSENPVDIIKECLEIFIINKCAKKTYVVGVPSSVHRKEMREKWFKEVLVETFCLILYNGKVKEIHMSI